MSGSTFSCLQSPLPNECANFLIRLAVLPQNLYEGSIESDGKQPYYAPTQRSNNVCTKSLGVW